MYHRSTTVDQGGEKVGQYIAIYCHIIGKKKFNILLPSIAHIGNITFLIFLCLPKMHFVSSLNVQL